MKNPINRTIKQNHTRCTVDNKDLHSGKQVNQSATSHSGKVIEDMFRKAKIQTRKKKASCEAKEKDKKMKLQQKLRKMWKEQEEQRRINQGEMPTTARVSAGIKIYTEEELNIGKGGNTRLCPINCTCCF